MKKISAKRREKLRSEVSVRQSVCERAGGIWEPNSRSVIGGRCIGGRCENIVKGVRCGNQPKGRFPLEFAHEIPRSLGGETTEGNCKMKCLENHHSGDHGGRIKWSEPQWSKPMWSERRAG